MGWKTRENVVILNFLAVDNFYFTRKIVKKNLGKKLVKMLVFCQNWLFGPKFDFSNSVSRECPFGMHAQQFSLMCRLRVFTNFVAMFFLIKSYSKPSKPKKTQNVEILNFLVKNCHAISEILVNARICFRFLYNKTQLSY